MICSTKTENLTAVEGYIMADRRNLFFFYGDDKATLVEK